MIIWDDTINGWILSCTSQAGKKNTRAIKKEKMGYGYWKTQSIISSKVAPKFSKFFNSSKNLL